MAFTEREVIIANPARRKARKGNMTTKQIKFFGTKRQRAALKAKRSNAGKKAHRKAATRPKSKSAHRKRTPKRATAKRSNPGEIISLTLGNPAKRRKKAVAKTRRKKNTSARRHTSAGHRTKKRANPGRRGHRRRSNPGGVGLNVTDLVALGGGAVVGGTLPTVATQAILGSKNNGFMGYAANLAATFVLAWGVNRFSKGKTGHTFSMGIIAGGIGSVIKRAITDYSILGSFGQQLGMGDYMVSNWVTPQRMVDGLNSAMVEVPNGWGAPAMIAAPAGAAGGMGCFGPPLYG